ncbi:MAG: glycosyltransferase family 9 protein [Gemmatimonadota bacterium]
MSASPAWTGGRVCVVMMSAIGDAVHALPVVTALKRHTPTCRITWVLQPGPAALVRGHPAVDEIVLFEKSRGWRAYRDVRRRLPDPFDLVLSLQVAIKGGIVTALTRAPVKLGFDRARARDLNWLFTTHRIPPHRPQHVQDQYFEFLDALGVPREPVRWDLGPWPRERDAQRRFTSTLDRPAVALAIGSSDREREWLPDRWADVAAALDRDFGLEPVLVGGRSPRELATEAAIGARAARPLRSTLGIPLRDLVGVLDASALVVSVNTAPLHLAVALERPVIGLLGHWNPKRTGPYRRFGDLQLDAYGEPGEDYPISLQKRPGRMGRITVRDVLEKAEVWRSCYGPTWRGSAEA